MKKLTVFAFLPLLGLVLGTADAQNPVPTRVKTDIEGVVSGYPDPSALQLALDASGPLGPAIRFAGGLGGHTALLAFGLKPAEIKLPNEALLLVDPLVALIGEFDPQGVFELPFDVVDPAVMGAKLYVQGLHFTPQAPGDRPVEYFQMSERLVIEVVAGNAQPPLAYKGPPLTATLIAKRDQDIATHYEVFHQITVPTSGYDLVLQSVARDPDVTRIYLVLVKPDPQSIVLPRIETKRLLVDLEIEVAAQIEILIEERFRSVPGLPAFLLAAMIERDF